MHVDSSSRPQQSPAARSTAFASLSRMRFTRVTVNNIVRYLQQGALPAGWSRARAWRFRHQVESFRWQIRKGPARRWPARNAERTTSSQQRPAIGEGRCSLADKQREHHILEVQLPDPSADGRTSPRRSLTWLRVLPEEDIHDALHDLYVDPAQGGLRGAKALYERALNKYVGISMQAVVGFLNTQETRQAVLPKQGYLIVQPLDVDDVGHWQADLTDVALFTKYSAKHLLVCVDSFSKFAWAAALDSKHASNVAAALERLFLHEGPPKTLRSDGGSDMANSEVAALCVRYNVERRVCAPYNSQCNGGVERLHRTLKETMAKHTHEWLSADGTVDWVTLLPFVLYSYYTSVHRTTGLTPFLLQRGRAPRPLAEMQMRPRKAAPLAGPALFEQADESCTTASWAPLDAQMHAGVAPPARPAPRCLSAAGLTPVGRAAACAMARSVGEAVPKPAEVNAATPTTDATGGQRVPPARTAHAEPKYTISRVVASMWDPARKEMRYWARWAGYTASADSWITAAMAGSTMRHTRLCVFRQRSSRRRVEKGMMYPSRRRTGLRLLPSAPPLQEPNPAGCGLP